MLRHDIVFVFKFCIQIDTSGVYYGYISTPQPSFLRVEIRKSNPSTAVIYGRFVHRASHITPNYAERRMLQ